VKLKLDENVAASAKPRLAAMGYDVDTVLDEALQGATDEDVWAAAQREGRVLVTQDLDFSDVRRFQLGTHAGIVLLRLPDDEQWRIADFVVSAFALADARTWSCCFVVVSATKIRVTRGA
jgi:predicted nuclease of predicted toxin-antitoxin system